MIKESACLRRLRSWLRDTFREMMEQEAGIPDESLLILLRHCRDMKRQELHLRLVTLLVLLSCTALFVLTNCADFRRRQNSASGGREGAGDQSPAYGKQQSGCPTAAPPSPLAEIPQRSLERLRIHLHGGAMDRTNKIYLQWNGDMYSAYDPGRRAVVIPERGFYFVYVKIALSCQELRRPDSFHRFHVAVHSWNPGYNDTLHLMDAFDGVTCTALAYKNLFVGQLFDLLAGDHVSVWIGDGQELIVKASFGLYLT